MIVIVGAGPAGIAAARRARECGAEVTVIDDNPAPGGQIWRGEGRELADGVRFVPSARVVSGDRAAKTLLLETEHGAEELPYDHLILATGSRELFLPFPGWTLPGIFGVGGLQALAKSGLPLRRKRILVAGSGPLLLAGAAYFRSKGAEVVLIAEQADALSVARFGVQLLRHPAKLMQAAQLQLSLLGVPARHRCWVEAAEGTDRVERVLLRQGSRGFTEQVDYAAIAWGLVPNDELATLLGCDSLAGTGGVDVSTVEGEIAGFIAAGREDLARELYSRRDKAIGFAKAIDATFALRAELRGMPKPDTVVCRCEDVTLERLQPCSSFRAAKLHTRSGMGPCQGRICGPAARFLFEWQDDSIRPPVLPARIGTLIRHKAEALTTAEPARESARHRRPLDTHAPSPYGNPPLSPAG
jgi:NADPH-dependent 2,4-dienoyl-CoA reductase/sulfur reductase-like enzyme